MVLAIPPMCMACGFAYALLAGFGTLFDVVFWCAAVVVSAIVLVYWIWSRVAFARSLSAWFGTPIHWFELPRMTPRRFDQWCSRRGLRHVEPAAAPDGDAAIAGQPVSVS